MNPESPQPIDYATPATRQRRIPITSIGLTFYLGFLTASGILLNLIFLSGFVPLLKDGLAYRSKPMPHLTEDFLVIMNFLCYQWGIYLLIGLPILAPIILTPFMYSEISEQAHARRRQVYRIITFVWAVLILAITLGGWIPIVIQIEGFRPIYKQ